MGKSLTNKVRNIRGTAKFIAGGAAAAIVSILAACNPFGNASPDLKVSTNSGTSGSKVEAVLGSRGAAAIKYILKEDINRDGTIDKTISQADPITLDEILTSDTDFYGQVESPNGAMSDIVKETVIVISPPPVNHAPVITSTPITSVDEGVFYEYDLTATDADGDTITYDWAAYPQWLTKSGNKLSGTAPQVDTDTNYNIEGDASDGKATTKQPFAVTVKNVVNPPSNHAPVITSTPITSVDENSYYEYDVSATDADGDTLTFSLAKAPSGFSISDTGNPNTKKISWTSSKVNSSTSPSDIFNIEVDVSDGKAPKVPQSYQLVDNNLVDVSGAVNQSGVVRFYDTNTAGSATLKVKSASGTVIHDSYGDGVQTDGSENFSVTLEKIVDSTDTIYLQAGSVSGSNALTTYVRTVDLPATDEDLSQSNDVRVKPVSLVPNDTVTRYGITPGTFKQHITEVATTSVGSVRELVKYNVPNKEIAQKSPHNASQFSSGDFATEYQRAVEWRDIIFASGGPLINIVQTSSVPLHYNPNMDSSDVGWAVEMPDDGTYTKGNDGFTIADINRTPLLIEEAKTYLMPPVNNGVVSSHEGGLAEAFYGEAKTLSSSQTIMTPLVEVSSPTDIDKGAVRIVYNPTFVAREPIDNVIRLNWGFSSP